MKKSTATLVQEMLDREAIRDLPILYCHYVWQNDVKAMVNLFTEDGSIGIDDGTIPNTKGRKNLIKMYEKALGDLAPRPFIHNHVVNLDGPDQASGTCYVEIRGITDGESIIGAGYYNDEYRKVDGDWKFLSRDVKMYYMVPLEKGWAEKVLKGKKKK
tara:strand:- start:12792 stop:13265 length:474 start_codon:yes stop_codon:yes gene_type:complete